jgi:hypothetical protein
MNNRIAKLEALAAVEGMTLPSPSAILLRLAATGAVVDRITGDSLSGEADTPYAWAFTPTVQRWHTGCSSKVRWSR